MSNLYIAWDPRSSYGNATTDVGAALTTSAVVIERQWPGLAAYDWVKGGFERTDIDYMELGARAASNWDV